MTRVATLFALALPAALVAQTGPTVQTRVEPSTITVGESARLLVTVAHAPGASVTWPETPPLGPFELVGLEVLEPAVEDGRTTSTAALSVTAFELGELTLPAFDLAVTDADGTTVTLTTDATVVTVDSVGRDEGGDIRDIKAPLAIPFSVLTLLPWVLGAAALAGGAWWLYRRYQQRARPPVPAVPPPPPRPAHEVAYEALAALEASGLIELGEVKTFHIRGSDIVRVYIEGRFGVDAMEMTTDEVLHGLERTGLGLGVLTEFKQLLERCDLVKFAKFRPDVATSRDLVGVARHLVDVTKPADPAPATQAVEDSRVA